MPRPTRVHVDGALCLVTCRALEGTALFQETRDYETYLTLLQEYQGRYGFKLFAYALLPDHLYLCLEPVNGTTVSTFMHALNSRYTKYVIKRHGRTGHVFQERFKLTLLEKAPWLLRITGYLHTHPRRSGVTKDLEGYRWSSYPSYLAAAASDIRYPLKGSGHPMVSDIGRGGGEVAEILDALCRIRPGWTYPLYLQSVPDEEWELMRPELEQPVVGSAEFVTLVERRRAVGSRATPLPATTNAESGAGVLTESQSDERMRPETGGRRRHSLVWTGSLAVASFMLAVVGLYTKSLATFRTTLQAVAQERAAVLEAVRASAAVPSLAEPAAALVHFTLPSTLAGTTWLVQVRPMAETETASIQSDQIRFEAGKLASSNLSAEGFQPSNYSLALNPEGTLVWGTMQTNPDGETVCWRGEWDGRQMRGVMTRQPAGKTPENFTFVGVARQSATRSEI